MPSEKSMKSFARMSITDDFVLNREFPVPALTMGGARIKVCYAGACYTDSQIVNSGQKRPRIQGVLDTSLFPGFEVSGVVDEICPTVTDCLAKVGDRVIVYPTDDEEMTASGSYAEYMLVKDAHNLIPIPDSLSLDVAAILPCGALTAYAAVMRTKPLVEYKLQSTTGIVNVLIVGAGGLGLWTLKLAEYYIGTNCSRVRLAVADTSIEKLMIAKEHGCYDVIHWNESLHEEYILMRIKNVCKGGVDAVIDFVSSVRTVSRGLQALKEGGVLVVGGNSKYEVPINFHSLATHDQSIMGVHRGSRAQLVELVDLVANGQIRPPIYTVFPVEEANNVFQRLSQSRLNGRAILRVCSTDDDSVFLSPSQDQLMRANSGMGTPISPIESPRFHLGSTSPGADEMDTASGAAGGRPPFFLP